MKLHDYQVVARDFLRGRDRAGLFLDMGLGKTATVLSALEERHLPALVLAPKRVAEHVWPEEHKKWAPGLRLKVAAGEPAQRMRVLQDPTLDVVVISRDNQADVLKARRARPYHTLVIDELSGYKSRGARWKVARRIRNHPAIHHVWGLTGTPAPNGYEDLWPQVSLIDPDPDNMRLGPNITTYRGRYFYVEKVLNNGHRLLALKEGANVAIRELIEDFCLYMGSEGRIKLPGVTYNDLETALPPSVRRVYNRMSTELAVDLRDIFGGEVHSASSAAILTSKLSQMAAGFLYVDDQDIRGGKYTRLHREKINALGEIIDGTGGSPVLAAYRFLPERDMMKEALGDRAHTIDEPGIIPAWNRGEVPVLLAHPASIGHGLNLQAGGHTAVWGSLTWALEEWEQFNGRLNRQGQQNPVVIHSLMAERSIDQRIREVLNSKDLEQLDLLHYLESPV